MRNDHWLISASDVSDYVFCSLAWRLRAEGHEPVALRTAQEAGTSWHRTHGGEVTRARRLHAAAVFFSLLGVLMGALLILYLVWR